MGNRGQSICPGAPTPVLGGRPCIRLGLRDSWMFKKLAQSNILVDGCRASKPRSASRLPFTVTPAARSMPRNRAVAKTVPGVIRRALQLPPVGSQLAVGIEQPATQRG